MNIEEKYPAGFVERIYKELPEEHEQFFRSLEETPPVSIRIHPKKGKGLFAEMPQVPWSDHGKYLPERPKFTLDPLLHAGAYYVQEPSSMFLEEALRQAVDLQDDLKILDLCAAPGGKSTLIQSVLSENSLLVSNEVIRPRMRILEENMIKWGLPNKIITNLDPSKFNGLNGFFDVMVVDAPCSGEGLFRKDKNAIQEWSPEVVQLCAGRQSRILNDSLKSLKTGGILIYSTCTYEPAENEVQVQRLVESGDFEIVEIKVTEEWNIIKTEFGYHFYPHRVKGEGLFISVLKKTAPEKEISVKIKNRATLSGKQLELLKPWVKDMRQYQFFEERGEIYAIPDSIVEIRAFLQQKIHLMYAGIKIGKIAGKDFLPAHDLALSDLLDPNIPALDLNYDQSLQFLRKQDITDISPIEKGWQVVKYEGRNLGWVKVLQNRINNYYLKEWRIRM